MTCGRDFPFFSSRPALVVKVSGEAVLWCQSLLKWLKPLGKLTVSLFNLGVNRPRILCISDSKTPVAVIKSPWVFFAKNSMKDHSSQLQHGALFFCILPCTDWPKGHSRNYLLFNLFKRLLFFRTLLDIMSSGSLNRKMYSLTVLWNKHSLKYHRT